MMGKIFSLSLLLWSASCIAATPNLTDCTPIKTKSDGKNIILSMDSDKSVSQIYLLKNNSKKSLWLDHPTNKNGASAGWSSYLRTNNWSALLVNRKEFSLSCAVIQPGNADFLNCSQAITVCASKAVVTSKRKGTYWLVEDKSWDDVSAAIKKISAK